MLTRKMIKRYAGAVTYSRGEELKEQGKVLSLEVEENDLEEEQIHALVRGSGMKVYNVELIYDPAYEELVSSECECPAFYSYSGICKHCVAVLIAYAEYEQEKAGVYNDIGMKKQTGKHVLQNQKKTTPAIKQLLDQQALRQLYPFMQMETYGKVKILPFLECTPNSIEAEFKIGTSHMYVMKDILEFYRHMQQEEEYAYGQKLQFVHVPEAFDRNSQGLLKFIMEWAKTNADRYQGCCNYYDYSYRISYAKVRSLSLTAYELENFLEAVGHAPFNASITGMKEQLWQVTDKKLIRTMKITGDDQGIQIEIGKLFGFQGNHYYIYFKDGLVYLEEKKKLEPIREFLDCMAQIPERKVYISNKDVPGFCRTLLPALQEVYECTETNFSLETYKAQSAQFEIYLDAPQRNFITCELKAVYGDEKYDVYKSVKGQDEYVSKRDYACEIRTGQTAGVWFNAFDEERCQMVLADDEEKIYELMTEGIPELQKLGTVFISDALKRFKIMSSPRVELGLSLSGELLELNLTSQDMTLEQLAEILSRYEKRKKFYRLKDGSFVNITEEMEPLIALQQSMGLTEVQLKKGKAVVPKYRALYLENELEESGGFSLARDESFLNLIRNMKKTEEEDFEIPASLEETLRDYQKKGFQWLKRTAHNGFGGILADDMGLGKTLQIIAFLLSEFLEARPEDNRRSLIVTPASLVFNWNNEFQRFAPALPVKMVVGPAEERKKIIQDSQSRDVLITSYDLLKRDTEAYEGISFYCQVLDEAQYIKNHNTQAARAVKGILSGCRFALTGTPIENRLSELWSIFDYLMPGFLYSYQRFRNEIETPVIQEQSEDVTKRLRKMIRPFILRRLKQDVLQELPEKLEENVFARLSGEQQKLYDAHVKRMKLMLDKQTDEEFKNSKIQILSELTRLRQLCCDPSLVYAEFQDGSAKLEMCMDLIRNAIEGGHKILLFSQFTTMLENIQKKLKELHISFYLLTGATAKEKRIQLVDQFNQDETSVFCISLKAGGTGLNLTAADIVIHYDPWWNLAVQNQATDRAHRIGQQNVVTVYKLIAKDTIEENIMKLQEKKKELADKLLSGENMGDGSFTREELLELLQ